MSRFLQRANDILDGLVLLLVIVADIVLPSPQKDDREHTQS